MTCYLMLLKFPPQVFAKHKKNKKKNRSHISKQLYSFQMFAYLDTMHLQHVTGPSLPGNILN